jgi:cellulose synthase/poly-beta-1,6-N-acetylglucosamine synthase-like glycosyltransferase
VRSSYAQGASHSISPEASTAISLILPGDRLYVKGVMARRREEMLRRTAKYQTYYAKWLKHEAQPPNLKAFDEKRDEYAEKAMQPFLLFGQEFFPFAPLRKELSACRTVTPGQSVVILLLIAVWIVGILFDSLPTVIVALSAVTAFYLLNLLTMVFLSIRMLQRPIEEHIDERVISALDARTWPAYTILCPLYKEKRVVPQFVKAMRELEYPTDKLQILFLTEEDDRETRDAIRAMNLESHFQIMTIPDGQPRTKPRACNYGLVQATGEYIVIYDAEDIPDPLQLKKAVLAFANHGEDVACVQAKLNFYNPRQNILTRWFTIEYTAWFDMFLPGLQALGYSLPLGGTSNHFRTEISRKLGGWDPFNVTEDCDLGLRLAQMGYKTVVLDSVTMEEANSRVKNWIRQRSRWIKGYLQTYLVYMRRPDRFVGPGGLRLFLSLQNLIGGTPATFFINPIMWVLLLIYIVLRPLVEHEYHVLYPAPIFYGGVLCLVFGNFIYLYIILLSCVRSKRYWLIPWIPTIPIYWAMMSIAAMVALFQLFFKPFYWEKTEHGLHLKYVAPASYTEAQVASENVALMETVRTSTVGGMKR